MKPAILMALYVLGVTYVRTNMFRSARYRASILQHNVALQTIHLVVGLLLGVALALSFMSGQLLLSLAGGLAAVAYDLALRQLCLRREIRRLITSKPGVASPAAKQHVLRRAELGYQALSHRRSNNVGLSSTVNLRLPVTRSAAPAKAQPRQPTPELVQR